MELFCCIFHYCWRHTLQRTGRGVYSSSPPSHCLFCCVWTSNSMLLADDIWLHTWHPWLIHTSLMHQNCFFRHSLVWCIHRSMEESTFPLVCSAKLKLMCVTVFRALFSCTGLSDLSFMCLISTHNLMPKAASRDFMFTWNNTNQSMFTCSVFPRIWSILTSHNSLADTQKWNLSFQMCNCINLQSRDFWECSKVINIVWGSHVGSRPQRSNETHS